MVMDIIKNMKIVPVVVINKIEDTEPVLSALRDGGLPIAEITFRTECAARAIELACEKFPDMLIGAGTVINAKQAREAVACGAKFIVGPGFSQKVAAECKKLSVPYLPGCVSPTDIIAAIDEDISIVKFFPASDFGGLKTIKALSAAFPSVKFLPTGGIDESNILEYLAHPSIVACGGSFMMKGTPDEIREKTRKAVELVGSKA